MVDLSGELSPAALRGLDEYKYTGHDNSILLRFIFRPLWNRLVNIFPLWLAPNLITTLGLLFTMSSYLPVLYYCPTLTEEAPNWVWAWCGIALLCYQWLDNLDGRQARRTGSSSPLGEIFDHGCDSINTMIGFLQVAAMLQMGTNVRSLTLWISGVVPFFLATWEEHHTGSMVLNKINGAIEGLVILQACYCFTGWHGQHFWHTTTIWDEFITPLLRLLGDDGAAGASVLRQGPLSHGDLVIIFFVIAAIITAGGCLNVVRTRMRGVEPMRHAQRHPFLDITPILVFCASCAFVFLSFPGDGDHLLKHTHMIYWSVGFSFGCAVDLLIVSHCTGQPYPISAACVLPVVLSLLGADELLHSLAVQAGIRRTFISRMMPALIFAITGVVYARYLSGVVHSITQYLHIRCFSIVKAKAKKDK